MSLDSLFQQVLLTEQQQSEQIQKLKDVKVSIIRCNEKIKSASEKYENTQQELNKKAKIRRESKVEEENFLQEISRFNRDFSLQGNKATLLESQTHSELMLLQREEAALHKEMEAMTAENDHMRAAAEEKNALLLELQDVKNTERDLDRQLKEAKLTTQSLRLESQFVSQKHLTDSTCVRLRKELEMYKEEELEHLKDTLNSEIQFLQLVRSFNYGACAGKEAVYRVRKNMFVPFKVAKMFKSQSALLPNSSFISLK
ncbi:coiled-coil domain-containing protein 172 isoform X2 [Oryzias latipes]|uniref:Coiled-coil domain-containing protein 172 n=1 Tax=Oryzias latipes TaxID=8090 RepID=A0A3B3HTN0_ORYLA|nr:coiled-coil domain-containing protein 172 isoform X2 [Oryzias latipes]